MEPEARELACRAGQYPAGLQPVDLLVGLLLPVLPQARLPQPERRRVDVRAAVALATASPTCRTSISRW